MSLQSIEDLTLTITLEMRVHASLDATFAALLEQVGPGNETPEGKPLPLTLEPWPGGRWFRDLGDKEGHFWGHVQAIKRPTLLEISGPLFASYPLVSNIQYRLSPVEDGTLINFRHTALGFMQEGHRLHVGEGWQRTLDRVRQQAEAAHSPAPVGNNGR
jgi:Activator of Hsp90 ATPase homolog 1-like protein